MKPVTVCRVHTIDAMFGLGAARDEARTIALADLLHNTATQHRFHVMRAGLSFASSGRAFDLEQCPATHLRVPASPAVVHPPSGHVQLPCTFPRARVHRLRTFGSTEHAKKCVAWTLSAELLPRRRARHSQAGHHSSSAFNRTCRLCINRAAYDIIYHIAYAWSACFFRGAACLAGFILVTHKGSSIRLTDPHHRAVRTRLQSTTCHSVVVFVSRTITRCRCCLGLITAYSWNAMSWHTSLCRGCVDSATTEASSAQQ